MNLKLYNREKFRRPFWAVITIKTLTKNSKICIENAQENFLPQRRASFIGNVVICTAIFVFKMESEKVSSLHNFNVYHFVVIIHYRICFWGECCLNDREVGVNRRDSSPHFALDKKHPLQLLESKKHKFSYLSYRKGRIFLSNNLISFLSYLFWNDLFSCRMEFSLVICTSLKNYSLNRTTKFWKVEKLLIRQLKNGI